MIKYEIKLGSTTTQFNTLEEATAYNPTAEVFEVEVIEPVNVLTTEERLLQDILFGKNLIKEFLRENRDIARPFTMEENLNLLNKFAAIEALCRFGDIKTVLVMIPSVEIDDIFTQERKDNFILTINNYLLT